MRQLAAIMFTDIQGYTALMQKDEENAIKIRRRHREVFETVTKKYNGKILQYYGDGTLSIFDSAVEAVQCGTDMQLSFREKPDIPVRIGIHLGDIIYDQEDIIGDGVNVASRIESLGIAGSVLISEKINDEVTNQGSIQTESLGEFKFKNITHPLEVFAVNHPGLVVPDIKQIAAKKEKIRFLSQSILRIIGLVVFGLALAFLVILSVTKMSNLWSRVGHDKSVAVLPFANLSDDPLQEYFIDGITEEIINHLARIGELKVISRTSIMNYKNSKKSIREIGKELGVSNILEGSVRKYGNQIRVSAQLINVETDHNLWAETYDRDLSEIFSIQTDLALNIANTLEATFSDLELEQIEREPTQNLSAYNSYLKALHKFETYSIEGYYDAINLFQETIELDPKFDAAYGWLALSYIYLASWAGDISPDEAKQKALPIAQKALEMNENLYQAHNALALINFWFEWNFEKAEKSFIRGLELAPEGATSVFYQQFLINMGRYEEALVLGEKSLATDPLHYGIYLEIGLSHFFLKHYDQAEKLLQEGLRLNPYILDLHNKLGKVYLYTGKYDLAIAQLEKGFSLSSARPPSMLAYLAIAHFKKGQTEETHRILAELMRRQAEGEKGIALFLAHVYSGLEDIELALHWLETAYQDREVDLIWLKVEPQFENLWEEPRFQAIIKAMGFPE